MTLGLILEMTPTAMATPNEERIPNPMERVTQREPDSSIAFRQTSQKNWVSLRKDGERRGCKAGCAYSLRCDSLDSHDDY